MSMTGLLACKTLRFAVKKPIVKEDAIRLPELQDFLLLNGCRKHVHVRYSRHRNLVVQS